MIAVVTGGSGFIGRNLVQHLLQDGHTVRSLGRGDRRPPDGAEHAIVRYDDVPSLARCPALDGADVVFHLAGASRGSGSRSFAIANAAPTINLLRALAERRQRTRFVYVSSQAAAGPAPDLQRPVREDDAPRPVEAYGASKLEAERAVARHADQLPATIVRPCSVFGPWDRAFLPLFRLAQRGWLVYPGIKRHWFVALHVADAVRGLVAAAASPVAVSRTYFLAAEPPLQWGAFGELVAAAVGARARHVNLPREVVEAVTLGGEWIGRLTGARLLVTRSRAAMARQEFWVCSSARARDELGFQVSRSLPTAVRDTYLWYLRQGWLRDGRRPASVGS